MILSHKISWSRKLLGGFVVVAFTAPVSSFAATSGSFDEDDPSPSVVEEKPAPQPKPAVKPEDKDTEVVKWLTKEFKVAAIPVSVFYHKNVDQKVIRFCFAKENDTLERAAEQLSKIR